MTHAFEWDRLVYLSILGSVLVGWFFLHNRQSLGKTLQQAMAWVLIFLGVIAAIGVWDDIRSTIRPSIANVSETGRVEIPRARDGHYYLTLTVNDAAVEFMVDTGASSIVLTQSDAEHVGLSVADLAFVGRAMTANGEVRTAPVTLTRIELGPVSDTNIAAWVNEGDLDKSLLGMSYLRRWSRIEISGDSMTLNR